MTKKNKILIIRLIIALIFWITAIILEHTIAIEPLYLSFYIVSYLIAGYDILLLGFKNILFEILLNFFLEYIFSLLILGKNNFLCELLMLSFLKNELLS